ncbi:hypothetical protein HK44_004755 [Pseudomonas fluorescens HK44]|uniref:Uncharacterized protein n=1 Tax=Pseudomonas fluorescens HK44 TaxID=1042209 RepID=A0A010RNK1_PSEFL|nr:hypothetical protein HK44_004755 [Pseudomonas fluorescens HK44]
MAPDYPYCGVGKKLHCIHIIALYRKFGFDTEGVFREYAVRDGLLVDALSMARLRRLLKAR